METIRILAQRARNTELGPVARWAMVAFFFVIALPLISLVHQLTVLGAASLLNWVSSLPLVEQSIISLLADQIYGRIALDMIGNTHAYGLAIASPAGEFLHDLLPGFFLGPEWVVEGAWISAVVAAGISTISQFLIVAAADGILIVAGVLLAKWGLRGESPLRLATRPARIDGPLLFGLLLQARAVYSILGAQFSQASLENSGLAHFGTKLMSASRETYEASLLPLSGWFSLAVQLLTLACIYALALLVARLVFRVPRVKERHLARASLRPALAPARLYRLAYLLPVGALAVFVSVSPTPGMVAANFGYDEATTAGVRLAAEGLTSENNEDQTENPESGGSNSPAGQLIATITPTPAPPRPSVVTVTGSSYDYVYNVDGKRELIRGMGYNRNYRRLGDEERAQRYEQDLSRMKDMGVNTILGWDSDKGYEQDKFDELLLAKASKYGLGVLMPYYLPPDADYSNEEYRAELQARVIAWVQRFKDQPGVRMWAIGNEVLHGMSSSANAQAFGEFYLQLADAVHREDPSHPVIYRDAEDVFVEPLKAAWIKSEESRPWLVYGMNIFTYRISRVLGEWERLGFDVPIVVTEFGPNGLSTAERPRGLVKMWRIIRNNQCNVLGGVVYAWSTAGPEPIDRVFGLVDENGEPVDGALEAIAAEFRQDADLVRTCPREPSPTRTTSP